MVALSPVLVTGASGFIGSNLVQRLLADGIPVRVLVRDPKRVEKTVNTGITQILAPLTPEGISEAANGCSVVYHLAGLTRAAHDTEFLWSNAEGARAAALGARNAGAKLVYVSSLAAAGPGTPEHPKLESDEATPITPYGRSKLEGEVRVQQTENLGWSIVRPPGVYGPHDKDFLFAFQAAKRGFFPVLGNPKRAYTLVFVEDLLDAILACGNNDTANNQIYFAGNAQIVTWQEILETLAELFNKKFRPIQLPALALELAAQLGELGNMVGQVGLVNRSRQKDLEAPGWVCSTTKIQTELGVRANTSLRDGFLKTKEWYEHAGWL